MPAIPTGLLRRREVAEMLRVTPRMIEQLQLQSDFPKPIRLRPGGHPKWLASDLAAYIARKAGAVAT